MKRGKNRWKKIDRYLKKHHCLEAEPVVELTG